MATEENGTKVETSLMHKGRKTSWHLQQMKKKGEKIVMLGPGNLDSLFSAWADGGADMIRFVAPARTQSTARPTFRATCARCARCAPTPTSTWCEAFTVSDNKTALETTTKLMADQADSVLIMGISNDKLLFLSDNQVPVFGHVGALSGWQTTNIGG